MKKRFFKSIIVLLLIGTIYIYDHLNSIPNVSSNFLDSIPEYSGNSYITVNDNIPNFTSDDMTLDTFEIYSGLDRLGRCGVAFANVSINTMPNDKRSSIGNIKPTGWHTVKYDNIDGKYLYNRCHLIGYQLTGENANKNNLFTCTRSMNVESMLYFENMVSNYIKKTSNHVLYRATPIFENDNLLATGVELEAKSVEDNGEGIMFHVFIYNVQEGININYKTGESSN